MDCSQNNNCKVTLEVPYPPVCAESCCQEYAYSMLSNIGSDNSEMSAVSLYFYNSIILNPTYAKLAQCFHEISIVEMHHLHIFATFASQMGLDPRLWSADQGHCRYWTPAYNCYPRTIRDIIENSIEGELAAIQKYTEQSESIRDANIVENLQRILLDERHHIEVFHYMLAQIC